MDENQYWARIWTLVAASFCILTLTVGVCTLYQQHKIAELVAGGADPIKSQCAIDGVHTSNAAVCGVAATK